VHRLHTADTLQVADRLRDLQVPARVVWGAADPFQRLPYGQRLAWDLRTELWQIEGGRHFTPEDHPSGWPPPSTRCSAPSAPADPDERVLAVHTIGTAGARGDHGARHLPGGQGDLERRRDGVRDAIGGD
jgi:hypothetical protein